MPENPSVTIKRLFEHHVIPTYGRFDLALARGEGSYVWDVEDNRYLDMGAGIAVCSLGHAHPELAEVIGNQAKTLTHISNLYYTEPQGRLAEKLTGLSGPGKCFFCNSGAEANEALFKLARKFGHEEGRFEIISCDHSFHGRTLAGIAATGQSKVKTGFEPMVQGFRQVPFNDIEAIRNAISPATAAVIIEGIQGEGGINPANAEFLLDLRKLCDEKNLLLLFDGIQCGFFRTGTFQSFERILGDIEEGAGFLPDGISMAKSLGGGLPIGAVWVRGPFADILGPGTHGTTFGGTPLVSAVALKILEIIERDHLADNARTQGEFLKQELNQLAGEFPHIIRTVRGMGLMLGIEFSSDIEALKGSQQPVSLQMVNRLHEAGMLTIPSGANVVRFLPPLNLNQTDAQSAIEILRNTTRILAK